MTPHPIHRTRIPGVFDLAGRPARLPRDLKAFAANEPDHARFGALHFALHLAIGACMVFALIWIALALPDDTAQTPAPLPMTYGSAQ